MIGPGRRGERRRKGGKEGDTGDEKRKRWTTEEKQGETKGRTKGEHTSEKQKRGEKGGEEEDNNIFHKTSFT